MINVIERLQYIQSINHFFYVYFAKQWIDIIKKVQ